MQAPMHSLLLVIKISNGPYYSSKHLSSVSSDTEVTCSKQLQLQKSPLMSHINAVFVIYLQKLQKQLKLIAERSIRKQSNSSAGVQPYVRQQYKGSRNGQESYKFLTLSKRKSRASAFVLPVMSKWAPSQEMKWHIRGPSHEYVGQGCFGLKTDSNLPVYPALTMDTDNLKPLVQNSLQ